MTRIKEFFKSAVIGGLLVVLPVAIFIFILTWIFGMVRAGIAPVTTIVMANSPLQGTVVDALVITLIIAVCFAIGVLVRTRLGKWIYATLEANVLLKAPGYSLIKETVMQFLGNKKSPFSSVALAQIYCNDTMVSSFITDEHEDGSYTVFVPTGPNPTSGNIYHLPAKYVHPVDVPVEDMMRSIISCGAGSSSLVKDKTGKASAAVK
jgi:uncharacterized membrane protein